MRDRLGENMPRQIRTKKLTSKDRMVIQDMYESGKYTMSELAKVFGVHKSRISHIVNDTYGEMAVINSEEE